MPPGSAIAGGSVIISANATQLVNGLNQAQQKVKKFAQESKSVWDKIGERFGGGGGGFLAKTLGAGFFGGIAGAIGIRVFDDLRDMVRDLVAGTAQWKDRLDRTANALAENAKQLQRVLKLRDEWTAIAPKDERADRLREDISGAEAEITRTTRAADILRKQLVNLNSTSGASISGRLTFSLDRQRAQLEQALKAVEERATLFRDRVAEARHALEKLLNPDLDTAKVKALNDLISSLRDKSIGKAPDPFAEFAGMARLGEAKALAALVEKRDTLKDIKELTAEFEEMADAMDKGGKSPFWEKFKEVRDKAIGRDFAEPMKGLLAVFERLEKGRVDAPAKEFLKTLQLQRMAIGMSANEAKLLELHLGGASQELIRAAGAEAAILAAVEDKKDAKRFEPKFAAALEAGSKEAFSLDLKHKFGTQGGDPNKGVTLWDLNVALLKAAVTLQKIEAKVGKAGAF